MEVEQAMRVLYLSYWVGNAANSVQAKIEGLGVARTQLSAEVERLRGEYDSATAAMPTLDRECQTLTANAADTNSSS